MVVHAGQGEQNALRDNLDGCARWPGSLAEGGKVNPVQVELAHGTRFLARYDFLSSWEGGARMGSPYEGAAMPNVDKAFVQQCALSSCCVGERSGLERAQGTYSTDARVGSRSDLCTYAEC